MTMTFQNLNKIGPLVHLFKNACKSWFLEQKHMFLLEILRFFRKYYNFKSNQL